MKYKYPFSTKILMLILNVCLRLIMRCISKGGDTFCVTEHLVERVYPAMNDIIDMIYRIAKKYPNLNVNAELNTDEKLFRLTIKRKDV